MRSLPRLHGALGIGALTLIPGVAFAGYENGLRCSVAPAADANGDGTPDVAVAARRAQLQLTVDCPGRVWILDARTGELLRTIEGPPSTTGTRDFGRALEDLGDLDGDGATDLGIVHGARVRVVSGEDGALLHELGHELEGPGIVTSLAGGRDVDGDGRPDVVLFRTTVDDPYADRSPETLGVVAIYSGSTGALLRVIASPRHPGSVGDERQGWLASGVPNGAVALVADRDGDGRAELALTLCLDENADDYRKRSELDVIDVRSLATFTRHRLPSPVLGPPWLLREIDDLDGDGAPDLLLTVVEDFTVVLSGARDEEIRRHAYDDPYQYGEGSSLDVLGDVNDDCVPDYLVAANEDGLDCDAGFVVVRSGADGSSLHRLDFTGEKTPVPDPFSGAYGGVCRPGADACAIGDVDGDGLPDVAVHVPRLSQVRILSGATFEELVRVDTRELTKEKAHAPR